MCVFPEDVLPRDAGECAICLEELQQGDTIARLPCLCIYHKGLEPRLFSFSSNSTVVVQWTQLRCGLSDTVQCQEVFLRNYKLPLATSLSAFPSQWWLVKIRQRNAGCPGRDVLIDLIDSSLTLIFGCTEQTSRLCSSPPKSVLVLRSVRETVKQESEHS